MVQQHDPRYDDSEYQYAGFWVRLVAQLVDSLIFFLLTLPFMYYQWQQMANMPIEEIPVYSPMDIVINLVFAVVVIIFWVKKGATPGKMLFGLQIRDAKTGAFISVPRALLRYFIGYTVSALVLGLGFIWAGFDAKKQGWHDKIASTVVVKRIR